MAYTTHALLCCIQNNTLAATQPPAGRNIYLYAKIPLGCPVRGFHSPFPASTSKPFSLLAGHQPCINCNIDCRFPTGHRPLSIPAHQSMDEEFRENQVKT